MVQLTNDPTGDPVYASGQLIGYLPRQPSPVAREVPGGIPEPAGAVERPPARKNKYGAQRTNGYASKKEAEYAAELELRQKAGEILGWCEQVTFRLPGGARHRVDFAIIYRCEHERLERHIEFVEVKGTDLPLGKLKRKQTEELHGITITVV